MAESKYDIQIEVFIDGRRFTTHETYPFVPRVGDYVWVRVGGERSGDKVYEEYMLVRNIWVYKDKVTLTVERWG